MNADTLRLAFTYVIAVMTLVGCFFLLIFPSQVGSEGLVPFVTGVVGVVLGFVFNRESTTAGARQSERSMALGQQTGATTVQNAELVTGGDPTIVNGRGK
jgi:FtsH-binding integral membrane protein